MPVANTMIICSDHHAFSHHFIQNSILFLSYLYHSSTSAVIELNWLSVFNKCIEEEENIKSVKGLSYVTVMSAVK